MPRLYKKYREEIIPKLKEKLEYTNALACPRIIKVTLNVGLGRVAQNKSAVENTAETLEKITGQKPVPTKAKQSISGFKLRQGMVIGYKVTLRGKRMYDFLEKLLGITFARINDFRGISRKTVDMEGNLSVGFRENIAFPEIQATDFERIHGLQITVTTTARNRNEGFVLFTLFGFPFKKEE